MSTPALLDLVRSHVAELGFELADLRKTGTSQRPILQVRIDRPDSTPGHGVTTDDCVGVSRSLEAFLETRAVVGPRYVLEVSSPGVERPLRWVEHWRRFAGRRARVKAAALGGTKEVEILEVPDDAHARVRLPDGTETLLALDGVKDATLVVDWSQYRKSS